MFSKYFLLLNSTSHNENEKKFKWNIELFLFSLTAIEICYA